MDKCIEQAERFLVLRDHNQQELRKKLSDKGYSKEEIDKAFVFLRQTGELDEERYVQSFVRSNNRKHPEGKSIVFQRLMAKGADRDTVSASLNEIYTREEYTYQILTKAYENLVRKNGSDDMILIKSKLSKLGFGLSLINKFLSSEHEAF